MNQKGTSVLELVTVIGIFSMLFGFVAINIFNSETKATIQSSLTTLVTDIKQQQIKAMSQETGDHGVYFSESSYTLFSGSTYYATNSANFIVQLGNNIIFSSVLIPSRTLVFAKRTGEIANYNTNMDTIIMKNTQSNEIKTIKINKLGVITDVN